METLAARLDARPMLASIFFGGGTPSLMPGAAVGRVIDAAIAGNAARWINHSCAPNCETYEDERGRVFVAARRAIRPGEELSYDYRLAIDGKVGPRLRKAYSCRCGARRCRGTMLA
jgi:SET domain-containing protein